MTSDVVSGIPTALPTLPPGQACITITGLEYYAHHGVMPQERTVGNDFSVDLVLCYDATLAAKTDNIEHALNYAQAAQIVGHVMAQPCNLLETLCANIARELRQSFPQLNGGKVTVTKHHPPMPGLMKGISVTMTI